MLERRIRRVGGVPPRQPAAAPSARDPPRAEGRLRRAPKSPRNHNAARVGGLLCDVRRHCDDLETGARSGTFRLPAGDSAPGGKAAGLLARIRQALPPAGGSRTFPRLDGAQLQSPRLGIVVKRHEDDGMRALPRGRSPHRGVQPPRGTSGPHLARRRSSDRSRSTASSAASAAGCEQLPPRIGQRFIVRKTTRVPQLQPEPPGRLHGAGLHLSPLLQFLRRVAQALGLPGAPAARHFGRRRLSGAPRPWRHSAFAPP